MTHALRCPSAWAGLENKFQMLVEPIGAVDRIVEIGVDYGYSLFCLAIAAPHAKVIGIDPYESRDTIELQRLRGLRDQGVIGSQRAEMWVRQHLTAFPNVELWKMTSQQAAVLFKGTIDVLHIDAVHTYDDVSRDFVDWVSFIRPGGCVLFHDTMSYPDDVGRFFLQLVGRKARIDSHYGLGAWYKPPE